MAGRHQGGLRRRRSGHEGGRAGRGRPRGHGVRPARGPGLLRTGRDLPREVPRLAPPHRDADHRRRRGRDRVAGRAGLLVPAPPPEADRGEPGAGLPRLHPPGDGRGRRQGGAGVRLRERGHRRVPLPGPRVLLPRDEHPSPGRAPGDRDGDRRRPRRPPAAGRRRRAARLHPAAGAAPGPRHRVPHQRRGPGAGPVPALSRARSPGCTPQTGRACAPTPATRTATR